MLAAPLGLQRTTWTAYLALAAATVIRLGGTCPSSLGLNFFRYPLTAKHAVPWGGSQATAGLRRSTLGVGGSASDFNLGSHGRRGLMLLQRWAAAPATQWPVAPRAEKKLRPKRTERVSLQQLLKPTARGLSPLLLRR